MCEKVWINIWARNEMNSKTMRDNALGVTLREQQIFIPYTKKGIVPLDISLIASVSLLFRGMHTIFAWRYWVILPRVGSEREHHFVRIPYMSLGYYTRIPRIERKSLVWRKKLLQNLERRSSRCSRLPPPPPTVKGFAHCELIFCFFWPCTNSLRHNNSETFDRNQTLSRYLSKLLKLLNYIRIVIS